ncbi:MAG TPA: DNA repair protein RecO [Burkholderiaceae bacterium]|nr:DNA repair protein RecO [Burkholderiaceae bacterium]
MATARTARGSRGGAARSAHAPLAAYVLHRYDWSESSLILDLFTREQGRVAVAAKGAKRPYSQFRAVLLPFQRIHVTIGRIADDAGASEIQNLRGAEWAGGAAMLVGAALFSGFYLNELLMKLLARHDPHPLLFDIYAQTLPALAAADEQQVQAALRAFELSLLRGIGVLPDLSLVTATLQPVAAGERYALRADVGVVTAGGRAHEGGVELRGDVLVGLQAALEHGSLEALRQACAPALSELRSALRGFVHYHLGSSVLRTREVMRDLQNL